MEQIELGWIDIPKNYSEYSDKQKKVQELYRDLGREITKQINK